MTVCLDFVPYNFFFPLATKLIGPRTGCQFFEKRLIFSTPAPLTPKHEISKKKKKKKKKNENSF